MERGLRQGDPLFPFLFLIAVEALQVMTIEACNKDDALFFGEWSNSNVFHLIHILDCFHDVSGLKINLDKSILFGIGVSPEEVSSIARSVNCSHVSLPFIYLGLPLGRSMKKLTLGTMWLTNSLEGVESSKAKNMRLMGKWKWRFLNEIVALWRRVIVELHSVNGGFDQTTLQVRNSRMWENIVRSCFDLEHMGVNLDNLMARKVCLKIDFGMLSGPEERHPSGRASGELYLLVSLINDLILDSNIDDNWFWSLND
ncbi:hypothetical protein Tco_0169725 [Tanacetum coccineum]